MSIKQDAMRWNACIKLGFPKLTLNGKSGELYYSMAPPVPDEIYPGPEEAADAAVDTMKTNL